MISITLTILLAVFGVICFAASMVMLAVSVYSAQERIAQLERALEDAQRAAKADGDTAPGKAAP